MLIAQHLPAGFTQSFAQRLNTLIRWEVREARNHDPIEPGRVYVCPGGCNMTVVAKGKGARLALQGAPDQVNVPNVDLLFESAADVLGDRVLALVLTGMGRDGAVGIRRVKERGGRVWAESKETAAIYGMPKEAARTGCVDEILPLPEIAVRLIGVAGGQPAGYP